MVDTALSPAERAVINGFRTGERVDLAGRPDRAVRAVVLRSLLLGGVETAPGTLPRLALAGARITGPLILTHARVDQPISLHECEFTDRISLYGAQLRHVCLRGSRLPGLDASLATVAGSVKLARCVSTATVMLNGARIEGSLALDGAALSGHEVALSGTHLFVGGDILAHDGFVSRGEFRLNDAEIGGALRWEGAQLLNPGGRALSAPDLKVGAIVSLCAGLRAEGRINLSHARIQSHLCLDGSVLSGTDDRLLDLRHLETAKLNLAPAEPIVGEVDLSHARIGFIRDDPTRWPARLRLTGLRYDALSGVEAGMDRLPWLRRDPGGYQPGAYGQLADAYRRAGREQDARAVLLADQRHRRATLGPVGRLWGHLQDLVVGYGYRPSRAVAALVLLIAAGTTAFSLRPPGALTPGEAPPFNALVYTIDLLLPLVDFGQEHAYHPESPLNWLAYALIVSGLVLATTIAAAATRMLRRD
ncbi:hypothetical protein [Catellatospora sp. NPDC049609]|uniref:hypothetical protein n=1 Tax=Catellatospora sp. NPDC049609 TaxID=3155505 RepID=UPI003440E13D